MDDTKSWILRERRLGLTERFIFLKIVADKKASRYPQVRSAIDETIRI